MKNSSGLQVPLCHHGVAEIMGLAGLGRGGISQKPQCVSVANAARFGLTSQTSGALHLSGLACRHPALMDFAIKR